MDLVEKFSRFTEKLSSEQRAKPKRRQDRLDDQLPPWEIGVGSNEKYRAGWDKTFGTKGRDCISSTGKEPIN